MTIAQQIDELTRKRDALHAEMMAAPAAKINGQWLQDRVNEMAWYNRQLQRLQATPANVCV